MKYLIQLGDTYVHRDVVREFVFMKRINDTQLEMKTESHTIIIDEVGDSYETILQKIEHIIEEYEEESDEYENDENTQ